MYFFSCRLSIGVLSLSLMRVFRRPVQSTAVFLEKGLKFSTQPVMRLRRRILLLVDSDEWARVALSVKAIRINVCVYTPFYLLLYPKDKEGFFDYKKSCFKMSARGDKIWNFKLKVINDGSEMSRVSRLMRS